MPLRRKSDIERIIEILGYLRNCVELSNSQNLTDLNIYSENFFRDFLNLLLGYDLVNINIDEQNAAAIDLGDQSEKIAIQVTATGELSKVKKTVEKFTEKKLNDKYERLIILNITAKKNYQKTEVGEEGSYILNTKNDIWDSSTLVKLIGNLAAEGVSEIRGFLEKEVKIKNAETVPKEIETFQRLIEILSDEDNPKIGDGAFIEEPDPEGKIEDRFSNHSTFLKSEFQKLYAEYGQVLSEVRESVDLGQVKLRRLSYHLIQHSDFVLTKCQGNAKVALQELIDEMADKLSFNGIVFDVSAIRFFLLDELIRCNVFPNKHATND